MSICTGMCLPMGSMVLLLLGFVPGSQPQLQAYGCDSGWTDFQNYCYKVEVVEVTADMATGSCESFRSSVSSVWSNDEKVFILGLWQVARSELGFLWLGLRGNADEDWKFQDLSSVTSGRGGYKWSVLDSISEVPAETLGQCVALNSNGSTAVLDCSAKAQAFVCKKALPRVFVTSGLMNSTDRRPGDNLGHIQLFERLLPPTMTALPADSSRLTRAQVETEVACAFKCFGVVGCQVFQVLCNTRRNCGYFDCQLYSSLV